MKVNVRLIITMKEYLSEVNSMPLSKLEFYKTHNNFKIEELDVKKEELDDWDFTGLSNIDFIMNKYNRETNKKA